MTASSRTRPAQIVVLATGIVWLTSCAGTTRPQQFKTFFVPPTPALAPASHPQIAEPPPMIAGLYVNEVPNLAVSFPYIPRPSDTEFLLKRADDRYTSGKKALQAGDREEARKEFNRAIEILLSAPEDAPERASIEARLDLMVDSIYKYDAGEMGASD